EITGRFPEPPAHMKRMIVSCTCAFLFSVLRAPRSISRRIHAPAANVRGSDAWPELRSMSIRSPDRQRAGFVPLSFYVAASILPRKDRRRQASSSTSRRWSSASPVGLRARRWVQAAAAEALPQAEVEGAEGRFQAAVAAEAEALPPWWSAAAPE